MYPHHNFLKMDEYGKGKTKFPLLEKIFMVS